jgi:curli production assembly/transport component CsgG
MTLYSSLPRLLGAFGLSLALSGCVFNSLNDSMFREEARVAEKTPTQELLEKLPAAQTPVVLSVYEFQDQTGAQKPNDNYADFSRAVTQGGVNILYKALLDAGRGKWFTVIERAGLKNLLQERQLVRATREQYALPNGMRLPDVDPLLYAGVILEGGIVAYDSNITTGGVGAGYLGISANTQYRRDMVTVYLRVISVQTGEVLASVNTSKTIYSTAAQAGVFKYVAFDELLEAETGFSVNEPPQLATRQAVEYAVYSLVMEGALKGLWGFENPGSAREAVARYLKGRDGRDATPAELNRILGVQPAMNTPVPVPPKRDVPPPPAPVPAPAPIMAPAPAPAPIVSQPQLPAETRYIPPAPGDKPAEDKVEAQTYTPAPQLFKSNAGGPVYDVVCTSQGCFPSAGAGGVPAPQTGSMPSGVR